MSLYMLIRIVDRLVLMFIELKVYTNEERAHSSDADKDENTQEML